MAASAVASSRSPSPFIFPSLSPQYLIYSPSILPKFPPFASTATARCSFSVSAASSSVTSEENKRMMLEGYGLNPDEYISDQTLRPPRRSREEQMKMRKMMKKGKNGKGRSMQEELVAVVEGKKATRSTHKLLKVLGGTARRKKLLSPKSMDVRPMMEVVRGAAFDILQVAGGCPASLRPGRWLDLYSGTGSVGIEAISRGCSEAHFVELDPWVVSEVLKPNLEWTGFLDSSVIHTKRVESFLEQAGFSGAEEPFDYISVTPPYTAVDYKVLLGKLGQSPLVGEDCFILVEYPLETTVSDSCGHLIKISDRRFGRTNLIIYGPEWAQKKRRT